MAPGELTADDIDYDNPPFPLTAIDREVLATRDEDFHRITWEDLRQIIATNALEELKRVPSDLRRYLAWAHHVRQTGGIVAFVLRERLRWTAAEVTPDGGPSFAHRSAVPFADPRDYAILRNDWPYGFADGIVHLLVWSKTPIAVDPVRGDLTPASRRLIDDFVARVFARPLGAGGADRVQWFKNWVSLQSVRGVDHVHVMVKDAPPALLEKWTERNDLV